MSCSVQFNVSYAPGDLFFTLPYRCSLSDTTLDTMVLHSSLLVAISVHLFMFIPAYRETFPRLVIWRAYSLCNSLSMFIPSIEQRKTWNLDRTSCVAPRFASAALFVWRESEESSTVLVQRAREVPVVQL